MEIGLYTFGELTPHWADGRRIGAEQRLKEILAAAKLADEAGFAVFALGEHHRLDFSIAATPVVLAAIAQVTARIRLASAVTILSTADPVKVFEDFATVDLLSGGRVEVIAGRGVFTESFPLFGYDLADQDELFAEKLDLLLRLNAADRVTWQGRFRPALHDAPIPPRPVQARLPIWVGTGGTRGSVVRAGALGLPLALANIGLPPAQLAPLVDLYRRTGSEAGHGAADLKVAVASHLHVQRNSQDAMSTFSPYSAGYFRNHAPDQYRAREISRDAYEQLASREGALFVGSPQQIVDKIFYGYELFRHQRFMAQIDIGGLPYPKVAQTIELLATEVAPAVQREIAAG
jgi:alkanesulfonate monooxygenase SsuD/methylene tetrahydromethanopterin reductase-like flavin-dependent oxidoreductase (luciferase family)